MNKMLKFKMKCYIITGVLRTFNYLQQEAAAGLFSLESSCSNSRE